MNRPEITERHETPQVRINERIHFSPVRLIDEEGNQVVSSPSMRRCPWPSNAVSIWSKLLPMPGRSSAGSWTSAVIVTSNKRKPPAARKKQHQVEIKQIKYRPAIDDHDFETKTRKVREFLDEGHKVRVTVMFRRRDLRRPENGEMVLQRVH